MIDGIATEYKRLYGQCFDIINEGPSIKGMNTHLNNGFVGTME